MLTFYFFLLFNVLLFLRFGNPIRGATPVDENLEEDLAPAQEAIDKQPKPADTFD